MDPKIVFVLFITLFLATTAVGCHIACVLARCTTIVMTVTFLLWLVMAISLFVQVVKFLRSEPPTPPQFSPPIPPPRPPVPHQCGGCRRCENHFRLEPLFMSKAQPPVGETRFAAYIEFLPGSSHPSGNYGSSGARPDALSFDPNLPGPSSQPMCPSPSTTTTSKASDQAPSGESEGQKLAASRQEGPIEKVRQITAQSPVESPQGSPSRASVDDSETSLSESTEDTSSKIVEKESKL